MARIEKKGIGRFPEGDFGDSEVQKWFSDIALRLPETQSFQESLNPTSVAANSYSVQTFAVSGLTTNDCIQVNPPALTTGLYVVSARASSANTLEVVFYNDTGSPIDEGAGTWNIIRTSI